MWMREKLLELISQVQDCGADVTDVVEMIWVENQALADHLAANGVVIPVRCEECINWTRSSVIHGEYGRCCWYGCSKSKDGYCDRGERRSEDEE
jgi:hypothetical protein